MYFREIAIITLFIFFIHLAELDSKMQYFAAMHDCFSFKGLRYSCYNERMKKHKIVKETR